MAIIRHPLSGGKGIEEVSLYRAYCDLARENLQEKRHFEAILVCGVGLDVLLNTLPLRLLEFSNSRLGACQKEILRSIQNQTLTAGALIAEFQKACILEARLVRALQRLNAERNRVVHPIKRGRLKEGSITPPIASASDGQRFYRLFCHVIDTAGGQSSRKVEKRVLAYVRQRNLDRKKHFPPLR